MREQIIVRIGGKALVPFIIMFGLYVHFHGDYSPGGGFQAGAIITAAFVLYGLVYGLEPLKRVVPIGFLKFCAAAGVLVFAGVGVLTMLLGANFLSYNVLAHDPIHGQHYGIIGVEAGVVITVFGVMTLIFYLFAGRGTGDS